MDLLVPSQRRSPTTELATPWLRGRVTIVGIFGALTVTLAWLGGLDPVRLAVIAVATAALVGHAAVGADWFRTVRPLWVAYACNAVIVTASGGLESPLLPNVAGPAIAIVAVARSWRTLVHVGVATAALVVGWAAAPAPWLAVTIGRPHRMALAAAALMVLTVHLGRTLLMMGARLAATARTLDDVRETMLEDAALRSRALEAVGAKVAHELRNPLAALKSLLQLERGTGERDERSSRRFEVMTNEVARMESILRDYLSFSRPLENLVLGPVDLAATADHVVAVLEGRSRAAGVTLVRTGPSVVLTADGRRLKEALLNLAANALEATPRGGHVVLAIDRTADAGRVTVRDTGVGMSAAALEKLGTPFFTTREGGTGLGVVLARSVVQQHGGQLAFESRPGDGTTATVTIPFEVQAQGGLFGESAAG